MCKALSGSNWILLQNLLASSRCGACDFCTQSDTFIDRRARALCLSMRPCIRCHNDRVRTCMIANSYARVHVVRAYDFARIQLQTSKESYAHAASELYRFSRNARLYIAMYIANRTRKSDITQWTIARALRRKARANSNPSLELPIQLRNPVQCKCYSRFVSLLLLLVVVAAVACNCKTRTSSGLLLAHLLGRESFSVQTSERKAK